MNISVYSSHNISLKKEICGFDTKPSILIIYGCYFQSDLLVLSCDLICDLPLHLLVDVHRTYNSTVTMLLAQWPDLVKSAAPGSKARKKQGNHICFFSTLE